MKLAIGQTVNVGYYKGSISALKDKKVYVHVPEPNWAQIYKEEDFSEDLFDVSTKEWRVGALKTIGESAE